MKASTLLFALSLKLLALPAHADGIVNATGRYGGDIGTHAASTNRRISEDLAKSAINNFNRGISTFNIPLLVKAGRQAYDSDQADRQAKEFGQAALRALQNTGTQAGHVDLATYGADLKEINDYAHNSNKYIAAIKNEVKRYGVSISDDGSMISTPVGDFSTSGDLTSTVIDQLHKYGLSSQGVREAMQAAINERDDLAKTSVSIPQSPHIAETNSTAGSQVDSRAPASAPNPPPSSELPVASGLQEETDSDNFKSRQAEFLRQRDAFARHLGLKNLPSAKSPLGTSNQDLFNMIHVRYQRLRQQDSFSE